MAPLIRARELAVAAAAVLVTAAAASAQEDRAEQVYQIFQARCMTCHGAAAAGGLDLRTHTTLLKGGASGRVIVPHDPPQSRLYTVAAQDKGHAGGKAMKLPADALDAIRAWIDEGGSLESVEEAMPAVTKPVTTREVEDRPITAAERQLWAFRRPVRSAIPKSANMAWSNNPIDAFLFAALESKGVQPAPRADRRTLIRRVYQDLLGLPPSPAEVDAFVNDRAADAWPRLVDRLLASPHYGERWARHWLDLVRYADSGGFEFDVDRPQAWRYRDYVVTSFNQDKPYSQFVREQIAGDEHAPASDDDGGDRIPEASPDAAAPNAGGETAHDTVSTHAYVHGVTVA